MLSPDLIEGLEMFGMIDLVLFEGSATRYGAASVAACSLEPAKAMGQLVKYFYTASLYRVQACLLYDLDLPWLLFWSLPASPDVENLMICQYRYCVYFQKIFLRRALRTKSSVLSYIAF